MMSGAPSPDVPLIIYIEEEGWEPEEAENIQKHVKRA